VRRQYETLRAILTAAVNADYIGRTPCRGIKLPRVRPLRRPTIDANDLERLADALGDLGPMVWIASVLGLRWGECAGLKVGALDLLAEKLSVIEVQARGRKGRPYASEPKSDAGQRTLTIPTPLVEILAHHLAHRGVTAADAAALVFVAPGGGQLHYGTWRTRAWLPAVAECGLEGLTFHDLRRANATAMVAEGIDLKTAQTRFGHSDVRLTIGLYAQATAAADQAAASALGARLMPRRTRKRSSRAQ
jgi:integrase